MTVSSQTARNDYIGNGVTTSFPVTFRFLENTHLRVLRTVIATNVTTELILDSLGPDGFSVVGAGQPSGGTVTVITAPDNATERLSILRNVPLTQETDYIANDSFPAESHERALDKLTMIVQQQGEVVDRAVVLSPQTTGVSNELPGPVALNLLRWKADLTGLENAVPPEIATVAPGAVVDATVSPIAAIQSTKLAYINSGAGAVSRNIQSRLRDKASVKDNNAVGDGVTDDGIAIASAIADYDSIQFPSGTYLNNSTALVLPFNQLAKFSHGATITNSGSGSVDYGGVTIRECNNPGGAMSWTADTPLSYEGFSVELGGYGPRSFGPTGTPTAINGSVSVPAISTITAHSSAITGFAKTASPNTGAVALYGEGNSAGNNCLSWGINTRTMDNGFSVSTLWGAEFDMNVDNVNTTPVGCNVVGASSVEPTNSIGFLVGPLNVFNALKYRWKRAFMSDDGAAITGLELGSQQTAASSPGQEINIYFRNASNVRTLAFALLVDSSGNSVMVGSDSGGLFQLRGTAGGLPVIQINGNNLGFFNQFPTGKPTVTGSKGGNAALASLMTAMSALGLLTDSTT